MKRYPAFDPPEYIDWSADPSLVDAFDARARADSARAEVLSSLTEEQFLVDEDALNQVVRQQSAGDSWDVTMAKARAAHEELVETLRAAKVEDLWRPTLALSPDTRQVPVIELLMDDGCEHFDQHREYIERILAG